MKEWDPTGKQGPRTPMPDMVTVHAPKDEDVFAGDKQLIAKDKTGEYVQKDINTFAEQPGTGMPSMGGL